MAVATLNVGTVGGNMGLSFWDCFAIIVVVNLASCLLPAWTATFGLTGLRMTTFSRYSFGYWGNLLVVIFSMVSTTGWNAVNSISGSSVLYAVSDGKCPHWAGVIIICTTVWIICALGITWIHRLDAFLWIPPFIVWCVVAGTGAQNFDGNAVKSPTGADRVAAAFSFIAVIFSFAVSWINCAADYNVKMPVNTPRWKIFVATYIGICVPTVLVQTLGAALYSGTEVNATWKTAYLDAGVGGPLKMALLPAGGFGKFLMVLAGLSSIPVRTNSTHEFSKADFQRTTFPTIILSPCMLRTLVLGLSVYLVLPLSLLVSSPPLRWDAAQLPSLKIPWRRSSLLSDTGQSFISSSSLRNISFFAARVGKTTTGTRGQIGNYCHSVGEPSLLLPLVFWALHLA